MIYHPTNIIHNIPVDTIIVSIKTNTIPSITIKYITFSIVFWAGFYCFFSAGQLFSQTRLLYHMLKVDQDMNTNMNETITFAENHTPFAKK